MKIDAENLADFSLNPDINPTIPVISTQCKVYHDYMHLYEFKRLNSAGFALPGLTPFSGVIHNFSVSFALTSGGTF